MGEYISYKEIIDRIDDIKEGDKVYLISDILELSVVSKKNGEKFDRDIFIDTLMKKVGPEGTVMIPTFNWGFCKGELFDIRKTVSRTGALGNAAMKRSDFKRTKHPIYSFMVWGKDQKKLTEMDPKDGFGPGSIFEYMHKENVKALVVGLHTMAGLTFCHYVEQAVGVPFRYVKDFTAEYIDEEGKCSLKTYSMCVRDLEMDPQYVDEFRPLGNILEALNVSVNYNFNDIEFHVVDLVNMYKVEEIDILLNDSRNMYVYNHIK